MRRIGFVFLALLFLLPCLAPSARAQWAASYLGSQIHSIRQTDDGGYITSMGEESGLRLQKLSALGIPEWSYLYFDNFGSTSYHRSWYTHAFKRSPLVQTSDAGYALATLIQQQPNDTYGVGRDDIWFLKLDADGQIEWQRTYGGADYDSPSAMQQTIDGGYVLAGRTKSFGQQGVWVLKLDTNGDIEWENVYGGYIATSIQQTDDDGYILTGWTSTTGAGGNDIWVIKLDAGGAIQSGLQKTFGGAEDDAGYVIKQTADGGYILGGETESFNVQPGTRACMWILKLDASLDVTWQKTYGGTSLLDDFYINDNEIPHDVIQTGDGNFVVAGSTNHFGHGSQEAWIFKLDAGDQGAVLWEHTYGGVENDGVPREESEAFFSVLEAADGRLTAAGSTQMTLGELGFVVSMDADGQIAGCSLMGDSNAVVTDTAVSGQTTQAVPEATAAAALLPPGATREINPGVHEFHCPEGLDLSISIADQPDPIRPDHFTAYVLTAENLGTADTTNVSVTVVLPAELTYFSSTATQGTDSESGGTITFDVGGLGGGDRATLSVVARAVDTGTHTLTAEITADEIAFDQVAENNTASETTRVSDWLNVTVDDMDWGNLDLAVDSRGHAHLVYTKDGDLRYAGNASGEWLRWTLVDSGEVQNPAIAVDDADKVHIIYGDGPDYDNKALKYIHNMNGAWSTPETVAASAGAAWSTDLAVGTDGSLHLVFLKGGVATTSELVYMTTQNQTPGAWADRLIHPEGYDACALALDLDDHAHVIFYSLQVVQGVDGTGGVGYVTSAPSGAWQTVEEVDTDWSGGQLEGMALDIAVDSAGIPHIVFNGDADTGDGEPREDTRYAHKPADAWILDKVDDGTFLSYGKSISLDSDGHAHVSYTFDPTPENPYDLPPMRLRTADNRSGNWQRTTVSDYGRFNRIAVDRWDQAHVGYSDNGVLKYALVSSLPDGDGDGVGDAEESEAPNSGDGNDDGTPDSEQSHVVSLETADNADMVTLVAPDTTALTQVRSILNPSPDDMPENADLSFGFFEFTLLGAEIGSTTTVDFLLPDATTNAYFKYGPTPLSPTDHWHLFDWDDETGAQASGSTITLSLQDGQRGDHDLTANGIISDPGGPAVGPAGLQHIHLSPPTLEFGELMVGESMELDLTVTNTGGSDLAVDGLTPPNAPFDIGSDYCSGEVLVPDGSCLVTVSFDPLVLGEARDELLVLSDDPSFPSLGVTLLGTGMPRPEPEIQVAPANLAFGDVNVGDSSDLDLSVTNVGLETLHVGTVAAPAAPYSIVADSLSGAVIHTGDSLQLTVRFAPQASGPAAAALQIPSDDPDNDPLGVSLSGTGVGDPVPDILVSSSSVDFGEVTTGGANDQSVTVENTGNADLMLGTLSGLESPYSLQADGCSGQTLSAGANCEATIRFAPDAIGVFSDSLSIPSNDPDENPVEIGLAGEGVTADDGDDDDDAGGGVDCFIHSLQ